MESYASKPIIFLLMTLVSFAQFLFILRFLFEIARVSYNNPIAQLVVKATNPILIPFRIIPLYIGRLDISIIKNHSPKYKETKFNPGKKELFYQIPKNLIKR